MIIHYIGLIAFFLFVFVKIAKRFGLYFIHFQSMDDVSFNIVYLKEGMLFEHNGSTYIISSIVEHKYVILYDMQNNLTKDPESIKSLLKYYNKV